MQSYKNLYLIGTSHIAKESVEEVETVITKEKPSIVALELDKARFESLMSKEKGKLRLYHIRQIGFKGYVFAKVGEYVERKLGNYVCVSPGSEMLKAAEVAKKNNFRIALIDQRIDITLRNFSRDITWMEKFRFVFDIVKNYFSGEKIKIDLNKVPDKEFIRKILKQVKDRYPNFYKVLVSDRNKFMARKLFILMKGNSKVVGIVGAGHEDEIIEDIKKLERAN